MNAIEGSPSSAIDPHDLARFVGLLRQGRSRRVDSTRLWRALAEVYPHRPAGPAERTLLLEVLQAAADTSQLRLPPRGGRRWDRTLSPVVPTSVDLIVTESLQDSFNWRSYPWHQVLAWVPGLPWLSQNQIAFLRRVHEGLVQGWFEEPAPINYRSLQLTGGEKQLDDLLSSSLFAPGRLTLDALNCAPDVLPLAWEPVGEGGRTVIFENAGSFTVARRVLIGLPNPGYDLVVYGGGRSVLASLGHLLTIGRRVDSLEYVGDLDEAGLEIALGVREASMKLGLPEVRSAEALYQAMLQAAAGLGHPTGWFAGDRRRITEQKASELVRSLSPELAERVARMLVVGRRVPEEVLGPGEMREVLTKGMV